MIFLAGFASMLFIGRRLVRKVDLNIVARSAHCMQIITGFHMLEEQGLIKLDIHDVSRDAKKYPRSNMVEACVDNKVVAFDVSDGYPYGNPATTMDAYLSERCDYYFKRSFSRGGIESMFPQRICIKLDHWGLTIM